MQQTLHAIDMTCNGGCACSSHRGRWSRADGAPHPPARPHRRDRFAFPGSDHVMSSYTAHLDLPPVMSSVPLARHVVLDVLRSWASPHDLDDAALLVSELVSNVVEHARTEAVLTLELALAGAWLRISVADGSAVRPVVRELSDDRLRGRGDRKSTRLNSSH